MKQKFRWSFIFVYGSYILHQITMINFNIFPLFHAKLSTITVIISSLIIVICINSRLAVSFQPNWELVIISPWCCHQLLGGKILLDLTFMEVKHQEQKLFWHFRHYRQVDHFVCWTDWISCCVLFCLFWE